MVLLKNGYNRWVAHNYICGLSSISTIQIPQTIRQMKSLIYQTLAVFLSYWLAAMILLLGGIYYEEYSEMAHLHRIFEELLGDTIGPLRWD